MFQYVIALGVATILYAGWVLFTTRRPWDSLTYPEQRSNYYAIAACVVYLAVLGAAFYFKRI